MNQPKKALSLLLCLCLVLTLVACTTGGKPADSKEPDSISSSEESVSSEPAEPDNTATNAITLTDQAGREVVIPAKPEKLVSGYYITTNTMMALGLTDDLVGIEAKADSRPIYSMVAPELLTLPNVGSAKEFDVEGCLALEPDLVIAPARIGDSAETIAGFDIPVLLVSPESHEELTQMITLISTATGTEARGEELVTYYNNEMAKAAKITASLTEKPVVYMGSNSSFLSTAPKDMYQASLIDISGGINAGNDIDGNNWAEISYEQLLLLNPDVIIIPSAANYTKEDILADTQIAEITAVKNGAIYQMPSFIESWDSPGLAGTVGINWMLYALHEDLYSLEELQASVSDFYDTFYGLKEIDISEISK